MPKKKPRRKKPKTQDKLIMSDNCRRPKVAKEAFLKWVESNPEFKKRKPTVAEVVKEFRRRGSPLRVCVEQSVEGAAKEHWRSEAQYYLRHVHVVEYNIKTNEIGEPIRAYIPTKFSYQGHVYEDDYLPKHVVAASPEYSETVVDRARLDLLAWLERYKRYSEVLKVFAPMITMFKSIQAEITKSQSQSRNRKRRKAG